MKVFVLTLALFAALAIASPDLKNEFEKFKLKYEKTYESQQEEFERFKIFIQNYKRIEEHNKKGKWQEGINKFADLTKDEFKAKHLNGYVNMFKTQTPAVRNPRIDLRQLPESVDWRDVDAVSPVKDQKSCGSCWAFTTAEIIESYTQINTGVLPILSPQQITSCALNGLRCGGEGGCTGSIVETGLTYAQLFSITTEELYPYSSGNGITGPCAYDPDVHTGAAQVMGYELLARNDYATIMDHLANKGPLAVAVDASAWGSYQGGIFSGCDFNQNIAINHAVQLVGYGVDKTDPNDPKKYWIVRNSWSSDWGEAGYIKLERNDEAKCGTDNTPLVGVGCVNDGNDIQTVCGQCAILYDAVYPINAFVPPN